MTLRAVDEVIEHERCPLCLRPYNGNSAICGKCLRDYDRNAHNDGSIMEVILWAARRSRRFAVRHLRRIEAVK